MGLATKISNGWNIAMASFSVLKAHPRLIVFPIFSGLALLLIFGSAAGVFFLSNGFEPQIPDNRLVFYGLTFLGYLVNYFVVVFFNMALIHCAKLYFDGEEVSVSAGIRFSFSRIATIFAWAAFAATVGTILKAVQQNSGWLGKIVIGLIGIVWGVSTFFVVPVLAYEKLGPVDALKRSAGLMKERWGEGLTAGFTFGLINMVAMIAVVGVAMLLGSLNLYVGIAFGVLGIVTLVTIMSAVNSIFITAIYSGVRGDLNQHFNEQMMDKLFIEK